MGNWYLLPCRSVILKPNDQRKSKPMRTTQYFWTLIQPDRFSKDDIFTHLERVNHNIEDLLQLRQQLVKAEIPSYHLLTSIRELEETKTLLLMSAAKKFLSSRGVVSHQQEIPDFNSKIGWRESIEIFKIRLKIQWRLRFEGRIGAFRNTGN